MCLGDFANQAMGSEHADLACRSCRVAFQFVGSRFADPKQQGTQVAIAEAIQSKFSAVHGNQKPPVVGTEGLQSTDAATFQLGWLAKFTDQLPQWPLMMHGRQRLQIAFVRLLADFGSAMQIGDPLAQPQPRLVFLGMSLARSQDLHVARVVDRGFDPQPGLLLVVHLDRVPIQPMLDADSLGPGFQRGDHVAGPVPPDIRVPSQESQNVLATKCRDGMPHQGRIDAVQRLSGPEHHIRGPFGFLCRPVNVQRLLEHHVMNGVEQPAQFVQQGTPVSSQLLVRQGLSGGNVLDRDEAVIPLLETDFPLAQFLRQPFAAIQADMNRKRQPGLQPQVHKPQSRMQHVEVIMRALPPEHAQFEPQGLGVRADFKRDAGLDTFEDADQPFGHLVGLGDRQSQFLLRIGTTVQIGHRAPRLDGNLFRGFYDLLGEALRPLLEVFQEHSLLPKKTPEAAQARQPADRSAKTDPVEAVQNAQDVFLVLFDKLMHGAAPVWSRKEVERLHFTSSAAPFLYACQDPPPARVLVWQQRAKEKRPGRDNPPGPDALWAHRRSGYPSAGCLPAWPTSVSPGNAIGHPGRRLVQPLGHRSYALKMPGVWGQSPQAAASRRRIWLRPSEARPRCVLCGSLFWREKSGPQRTRRAQRKNAFTPMWCEGTLAGSAAKTKSPTPNSEWANLLMSRLALIYAVGPGSDGPSGPVDVGAGVVGATGVAGAAGVGSLVRISSRSALAISSWGASLITFSS